MLALTFLRYWWLRPRIQDPQFMEMEVPEAVKKKSFTSIMEPLSAPQESVIQFWSKIPYGSMDPMQWSVIEIEKDLANGKDMILIEPAAAGQVYTHYISHGWLLQENTMYYGSIGFVTSYLFPNLWYIYVPCSLLALMHSWMYFKVYKQDRLSQYHAYDDDRHPVSNLVTAWILGQRPDHFQYVLKKERVIIWEVISQFTMYASVISSLVSLKSLEEAVVGNRFISTEVVRSAKQLKELLCLPASSSGYFQPPDLIPVAAGTYLPVHIPTVQGWFDSPWFSFRFRPMKYDFAIIICAMGGYFVYKMFEHFFGYKGDEDGGADEVAREWLTRSDCSQEKHPYWVAMGEKVPNVEINMLSSGTSRLQKQLQEQERKTLARISSQVPYGWVPPGYPENHYGVFT